MPIYLAEGASSAVGAVGSVAGAATSAIGSVAGAATSGVGSVAGAGSSAAASAKPTSGALSFNSVLGSWSFIPVVLGLAGLVASM